MRQRCAHSRRLATPAATSSLAFPIEDLKVLHGMGPLSESSRRHSKQTASPLDEVTLVNESTQLANVVISPSVAHGVTGCCACAWSRSTPLALGLAQAERRGDLALHVRIDERSAGFLAVGIAKITRRPVAVVCTSGTAVANLSPAVVEAAYTGLPLVAVTADRPPELRGVGAKPDD